MKKIVLLTASLILLAGMARGQERPADTTAAQPAVEQTTGKVNPWSGTDPFPRRWLGLRGGVNLSDMRYSHALVTRYTHFMQVQELVGVFSHFQLGKSHFALRPELSFVGRGDSLQWLDVNYRFKSQYIDLRLPIIYSFRNGHSHVAPYLMVVPQLNLAFAGKSSYEADDWPRVVVPITSADLSPYDFSVLCGFGIDFSVPTAGRPLLLSIEAGYNVGLLNTFAEREIKDNPQVADEGRSVIANPFFGAELWQETRYNRGIEVALRLALPLGVPPLPQRVEPIDTLPQVLTPDTVYLVKTDTITLQPDTVYVDQIHEVVRDTGTTQYIRKDCYSFREMYAFITLGIDVSDKRICLFNINFDFDSYKLRPESLPPLYDVAVMMKTYPEMRIKVYGHTDSIGSDAYNDVLSMQRANAVMQYLTGQGIDANRIETSGFGKRYPIESNATPQGRFRNRRVEIEVLNIGQKITE